MRFRRYASADIGRINTQQDFLMTAAKQILANSSSINIVDLANTFISYVKTDMPLNNLIWFARRFMDIKFDNIHFSTAPGNDEDYVGRESYVTLYVDEWLEMINEKISPLVEDITATDLSILTRGSDRILYVTDGNRVGDASWGASSRGPSPSSSSGGNNSGSNSGSSGGGSNSGSGSGSGAGGAQGSPGNASNNGDDNYPSDEVIVPIDDDDRQAPDDAYSGQPDISQSGGPVPDNYAGGGGESQTQPPAGDDT
jgi:hypothetical protein